MTTIPAERIESGIRETNEDEPETTFGACITSFCTPSDPSPKQIMHLVEQSGVLDFWDHPDEDIYTDADGDPL